MTLYNIIKYITYIYIYIYIFILKDHVLYFFKMLQKIYFLTSDMHMKTYL